MKESNKISAIVFIYAVFMFGLSFLSNKHLEENIFRWNSMGTSFVILTWYLFDNYLWNKHWLIKISELLGVPDLTGTWKGTIEFEKDENGKPGKVDVFTCINQTFTNVKIDSYFLKPSESSSIIAKIESGEFKQRWLYYTYHSEAPHGKRNRNPQHEGACQLKISGSPPNSLQGSYFTSRKGAGIIKLKKISKVLVNSYEEAVSLSKR